MINSEAPEIKELTDWIEEQPVEEAVQLTRHQISMLSWLTVSLPDPDVLGQRILYYGGRRIVEKE